MLKTFQLEENPGVNAKGFFFQGHHWGSTDMCSDPPACILNFSARYHRLCVIWLGCSTWLRAALAGRRPLGGKYPDASNGQQRQNQTLLWAADPYPAQPPGWFHLQSSA